MQYTRPLLWLLATAAVAALGCVSPPDYADEPMIVYESMSKTILAAFNGPDSRQDSIVIQFSFTDGDGDISFADSTDIFIKDSRFPDLPPTVLGAFPEIPADGTGNGISGDVFFTIINSGQQICCIANGRFCAQFEDIPFDTLSYEIYIRDRAGNISNTIQTEQIQIACLDD